MYKNALLENKKKPKVLVYTSPSKKSYVRLGRCGGSTKAGEKWPPIKLMYLAGAARKVSNTTFIDADAEEMDETIFLAKVFKFNPDFMVIEPTPPSINEELNVIGKIKQKLPSCKAILTGAFASAEATTLLQTFREIDIIISGEAEFTLVDLLKTENEKQTKGLWYRENENVMFTGERQFVDNLDLLPFPAHDLAPIRKYNSPLIKNWPFTIMESSRGCPFSCTYCNSELMNGKKIRFRSPSSIIAEMKIIKGLGIKEIKFNDETFAVDKKRLKEIFKLMTANGLKFSWKCNSRVDVLDEQTLKIMKKNGCHTIFFGIESGNTEILKYYKKGISKNTALQTFHACKKLGITTVAHFILGAPMESRKTVKESVDFAIKLDADYVAFNLLTPYPGTEAYQDLKKRGLIQTQDWAIFDQSKKSSIKSYHLTTRQLEQEMKKAYKRYYFRPRYVLKRISKMRNPSDLRKNLRGLKKLLGLTS
jgi:anaerobic magnesium-protoporphyrin IX monomethyl ester cyclase